MSYISVLNGQQQRQNEVDMFSRSSRPGRNSSMRRKNSIYYVDSNNNNSNTANGNKTNDLSAIIAIAHTNLNNQNVNTTNRNNSRRDMFLNKQHQRQPQVYHIPVQHNQQQQHRPNVVQQHSPVRGRDESNDRRSVSRFSVHNVQQQPQSRPQSYDPRLSASRVRFRHKSLKSQPPYEPPSMIVPGFLFLGGYNSIRSVERMVELGITHVLNMAQEIKVDLNLMASNGIKFLHIPARDTLNYHIRSDFDAAFQFIDDCLINEGKIIVNCAKGISRSATIVAGYLMFRYKMTLNDALDMLVALRPIVNPNINFRRQLKIYELELINYRRRRLITTFN